MKQKLLTMLLLLMGMVQGTIAQKEAYVASEDYGNTVTFYYDDQKAVRSWVAEINNSYVDYWNPDQYPPHPYIKAYKVVFDTSFADYRPTSTAYWFCGCQYLSTFSVPRDAKTLIHPRRVTGGGDVYKENVLIRKI